VLHLHVVQSSIPNLIHFIPLSLQRKSQISKRTVFNFQPPQSPTSPSNCEAEPIGGEEFRSTPGEAHRLEKRVGCGEIEEGDARKRQRHHRGSHEKETSATGPLIIIPNN